LGDSILGRFYSWAILFLGDFILGRFYSWAILFLGDFILGHFVCICTAQHFFAEEVFYQI
jgi:hypothetical protein